MESANQSEKSKEPTSPFFQFLSSLKVKHLSEIQLFLFAFAMLLGNRTSGWNSGLNTHGVSALWYNHLFSASGFICLCLCMGEMASALPFSGGVFGFVRAALGPFFGFMIASCEFVFAILSISLKAQRLLSSGTDSNNAADSGGVIMIFAFCLGLNLIGGKPVFFFTSMMGFFVAMMLIVYLCGTLSVVGTDKVNFTHYSPAVVDFSWFHIMSERAAVGGQFSGIQLLPLLSEYMREPREQLPRLMLGSCIFFMVMTVFLVLAAISQDPGAKKIQSAPLPLQAGYVRIFHIHDLSNMNWFDLPFQISAIFCLFFCAGKQLLSLSRSGLLPPIFTNLFPGSDSPYVCYTFTAIVGAGLNIMVLYNQDYLTEIKAVSSTVSITILISCLISFLVFRRKFSSMARSFVNPLGDISAIYGIIVFVTSFWAILFYNPANKLFLVGLGGYWTLCAVFFCTYLVHHQKFSEEEKKVMFKAYLINANQKKRKNMLRNNKVGSLTTRSKSDNDLSQSRDRRNSQTSIGISASIAGKHAPPAEIRKAEEVQKCYAF